MSKLIFGTKRRYKYTKGQHTCHICSKRINKGLQLHHHGKQKSQGGVSVKAVHDKCHKKQHKNYNHILTKEDRRKAGLKTYLTNLRNQPKSKISIKRGALNADNNSSTQSPKVPPGPSQDRSADQQRFASR